MTDHLVTGLMSGSSLDGLDLVSVRFRHQPDPEVLPEWRILARDTVPMGPGWADRLAALPGSTGRELARAHAEFGDWLGRQVADFHTRNLVMPELLAVHGHTVWHEPDRQVGYSLQLGDGSHIAARTGVPVICDFRNADISLGGQGAPMAPLADTLLFPGMDAWLNLGGIANLTLLNGGRTTGWDVWACNQLLNALAGEAGLDMDRNGDLASSGRLLPDLFRQARAHAWHALPAPKSLDNDMVKEAFVRPFLQYPASVADRLATAVDTIATSVASGLPDRRGQDTGRLLVSGGGGHNGWLVHRLACLTGDRGWALVVPDADILDGKEALLIALAGLWRWLGRPNFLPSVTGAGAPACGGAVYLPPNVYLRR